MAVRFNAPGDWWEYTAGAPDTTAHTVIGWIRSAIAVTGDTTITRFRNASNSTVATFFVHSDATVQLASINGGGSTGLAIGAGEWVPVAYTVSGTTGTAYAMDPAGTVHIGSGITMSGNTPAAAYSFGGRAGGDTSEPLTGDETGFKIYSRALQAGEILTEWSQLLPVATDGLWAAYPMLTGDTTGRLDHSGAGRMLAAGTTLTSDGPPVPLQRIVVRRYLTVSASSSQTRTVTDTGVGTDTVTRGLFRTAPDTGSGSDSVTRGLVRAVTDVGAGADTVTRGQFRTLTEPGSGTDTATRGLHTTAPDIGAGADTATRGLYRTLADVGAGSDLTRQGVTRTVGDPGGGADTTRQGVNLGVSDAGSGTDTAARGPFAPARTVADAAAGSDTAVAALHTSATDPGAGSDTISRLPLALARLLADPGGGVDSTPTGYPRSTTDSGAGSDTATVVRPVVVTCAPPILTGTFTCGQPLLTGTYTSSRPVLVG